MYALISLLVFVAVATAQRPTPCVAPMLWEGRLFEVDLSKNVSIFGKLSYDAENERIRFIDDVDISGKRSFYDNIVLFREQLLYRIELSINGSGKCTVSKINTPFEPSEVPRNAKFATEAYIGASLPELGVLVNVFYGEVQRKDVKMDYVVTVTAKVCIPVSVVAYSKQSGVIHSSYFDIVLGIDDPERFVPPKSCDHAPLTKERIPMLQ